MAEPLTITGQFTAYGADYTDITYKAGDDEWIARLAGIEVDNAGSLQKALEDKIAEHGHDRELTNAIRAEHVRIADRLGMKHQFGRPSNRLAN